MPMPHITQLQVIKKRLKGKDGKVKLKEINDILADLPNYSSGPYANIRKWLYQQIEKTKTRSAIKHIDWLGVKREGCRQFMLVGCPSAGKSSLLNALSKMDIKVAEYAFTTIKPIPAIIDLSGADFQIVDLPGLIEGAAEDAGGGRRLIGLIKQCDGILFMHDVTKPLETSEAILRELEKAEIEKPMIIIGNKLDLNPKGLLELQQRFPSTLVVGTSTKDRKGLDELKDALWCVSHLIRVYTDAKSKPTILEENATVRDLARNIHTDLVKKIKYAIVNGPSAKFANQRVGLSHVLKDGDRVRIITH